MLGSVALVPALGAATLPSSGVGLRRVGPDGALEGAGAFGGVWRLCGLCWAGAPVDAAPVGAVGGVNPLAQWSRSVDHWCMATEDLPEAFHVTTDEQLRAVSSLTRHRIMGVLRFEPATITQIAERVGLAKGSSSYHVRLLERVGLVRVVRTRKVRGVTERYYAMAARSVVLPDPGEGGPDVLMRHAVADLEAAPVDGERHVRMAHLRLTEGQFAELGARLEALAEEYRGLSDPSLPDASFVFALFRPASGAQGEGDAT